MVKFNRTLVPGDATLTTTAATAVTCCNQVLVVQQSTVSWQH